MLELELTLRYVPSLPRARIPAHRLRLGSDECSLGGRRTGLAGGGMTHGIAFPRCRRQFLIAVRARVARQPGVISVTAAFTLTGTLGRHRDRSVCDGVWEPIDGARRGERCLIRGGKGGVMTIDQVG